MKTLMTTEVKSSSDVMDVVTVVPSRSNLTKENSRIGRYVDRFYGMGYLLERAPFTYSARNRGECEHIAQCSLDSLDSLGLISYNKLLA